MISFLQIGCKITIFYGYGQIKCTKTAKMCTLRLFCAMYEAIQWGLNGGRLLDEVAQDVARQLLRNGTRGGTRSILGNTTCGGCL